jgi:hypothetical protein
LKISRGSVCYLPRAVSSADLAIMRRLDQLQLEFPFAGSRMLRGLLAAAAFSTASENGLKAGASDTDPPLRTSNPLERIQRDTNASTFGGDWGSAKLITVGRRGNQKAESSFLILGLPIIHGQKL